jgi:hypothetical protein
MKNLQLSLKTKWFEMTKSGIKTEDYREINSYWFNRLMDKDDFSSFEIFMSLKDSVYEISTSFKRFTQNTMTLGYPKTGDKERILKLEHQGIEIRTGNPEWGAESDKLYFVILHGSVLE